MLRIRLGPSESAHLASLLARLRDWDPRAAVHLQVTAQALGLTAPTPFGALAFVAVPLAGPVDPFERTVSAGRLRDTIGHIEPGNAVRDVAIPDAIDGPRSLLDLPPRTGWRTAESGLAKDVTAQVDAMVSAVRAQVPPTGLIGSEQVADAAWDQIGWGGLPLRALHAAALLGLLGHPDAHVRSATASGWIRLETPAGQVFFRTAPIGRHLRIV